MMKVTVELSDQERQDMLDLTGERHEEPALKLLLAEALQMRRRTQIAERFISGEWGVELSDFEATRARDHAHNSTGH